MNSNYRLQRGFASGDNRAEVWYPNRLRHDAILQTTRGITLTHGAEGGGTGRTSATGVSTLIRWPTIFPIRCASVLPPALYWSIEKVPEKLLWSWPSVTCWRILAGPW